MYLQDIHFHILGRALLAYRCNEPCVGLSTLAREWRVSLTFMRGAVNELIAHGYLGRANKYAAIHLTALGLTFIKYFVLDRKAG
jgi:hypothetical protein